PTADSWQIISVENNTTTTDGKPSYSIKAAVSLNLHSVCPERYNLYYDYPKSNFVTWKETITSNCDLCMGQAVCVIAFPEEAVLASYKSKGGERVASYIQAYPDAKPDVTFMYSTGNGLSNVWLVVWSSPHASYALASYVSKADGTVLQVISQ
ncbi:MAG TPA: hypothetical protein PLO51_01970, partial [Candidatus Micrarchaeota archaeon]|nr:hypothetical protein [Candidatus Micrarchaeota archaeon]